MLDSFKHKGARKLLVKELREMGIENESVLQAIEKIPRHFFLEKAFHHNYAYSNKPFPIGAGQTISHPRTVALQSSLLNVQKGDKVLEVGTGSGYQTIVLLELGAKVYSIERQKLLADKSKMMIKKMGYIAKLFYGDGYKGLPTFAPFDKILVTAGAPYIPEDLKSQLKVGGVLVIPVGEGDTQEMYRLTKISETEFETEQFGEFKFVPLLEDKSR